MSKSEKKRDGREKYRKERERLLPNILLIARKKETGYTVTRPYAGFRHPDRMAPDQTVREGENDFSIWPGNLLPKIPKFSVIKQSFS